MMHRFFPVAHRRPDSTSGRLGLFLLIAACVLINTSAQAQTPDPERAPASITSSDDGAPSGTTPSDADPSLATPEATMFSFLDAMARFRETQARSDLDNALRAIDLTGVPNESRRQIAGLLLRVIDSVSLVEAWHFSTFGDDAERSGRYAYYPQRRVREHADIARLAPDAVLEFTRNASGE
jgi:hypothetical protein